MTGPVLCRTAFSTTLASARSSSPGSASTGGSVSGTSTSTRSRGTPRRTGGTTCSSETGWVSGETTPVCSRLMSSRLPMRPSSLSADSSTVASSSASSSGSQSTSVWRRLLTRP
ncbi:hypothetical protein ACFQY7_07790 [Actinomadura luteofluorescens]|uniref:hypothetical protein n=1 Tax=Actinomadura luteofluorescens TaxID=46163 RepID=UPI003640D174